MILSDEDAAKRLNSPLNLINRMAASGTNAKAKAAMSIFIPQTQAKPAAEHPIKIPQDEPEINLDSILENSESKIRLGLAHDKALALLNRSVELLDLKLDDVKADKLPSVISAASKTVESIRKERSEAAKMNKDREVHYHFYTPNQKKVEEYEIIDVT